VSDVAVVLIVILVIALVLRGPRTLPQLGAFFGRGVRAARDETARMRADKADKDDDASAT
jgi:Sec-independent protein translocase protein TatA